MIFSSYLNGFIFVLLFYFFSRLATNSYCPIALARSDGEPLGGEDYSYSASKLQAIIWTYIILFCFTASQSAQFTYGGVESAPEIPISLLVLMGLSATTAVGAKGIKVQYLKEGRIGPAGESLLNSTNNSSPDLIKVQMLTWNLVGAIYYIANFHQFFLTNFVDAVPDGPIVSLPDIDSVLLVLMGAAKGTYLGNKLLTQELTLKPTLLELLPSSTVAEQKISLRGHSFGSIRDNNFVILGKHPLLEPSSYISWTDTSIEVNLPSGKPLDDNTTLLVSRNGVQSDAKVLNVSSPSITEISPPEAKFKDKITIIGENFGSTQESAVVLMNNKPLTNPDSEIEWSDNKIIVDLPEPPATLSPDNSYKLRIKRLGRESNERDQNVRP